MNRLLLHTCCAPCLIYPLERLKEKGFSVAGLFYNPNIHPFSEYKKRRQAVEDFNQTAKIEIIYPHYQPEEFFQAVNLKEAAADRCGLCWHLRLENTARVAKEEGFTFFSTTLLVSPYQNQELLKKIGDSISGKEGINFYYEDFRTGFKKAHDQAKAKGIYCQKYCGCIYSMKPRLTKRSGRKSAG